MEGSICLLYTSIPDDRLVVVTGPNGGGKTTLAKLIAGLRQPTAGSISFDGQDITGLDITSRARMGIAYAFQQPVHFKGLRTRDILEPVSYTHLKREGKCESSN